MIQLMIIESLTSRVPSAFKDARLISTRKLSRREVKILKENGIHRFYLPELASEDGTQFLTELDRFWDQVIADFGPDHVFWRNIISSKMQEWEYSACYLALILFTLKQCSFAEPLKLIVLVSSLEEEDVWRSWAKQEGWETLPPENLLLRWMRRNRQEFKNFIFFGRLKLEAYRRKIYAPSGSTGSSSLKEPPTVLLASLFYPWSLKKGEYQDPFFGGLHQSFRDQGKPCMYLSDSLVLPDATLRRALKEDHGVRLQVPYSLLSWFNLIRILWNLFFRRIKIHRADFMGHDFRHLLGWNARRVTHSFNLHAEVFFEAMAKLSRQEKIERFLYIFEGNVFERACLQAVRRHSSARSVGYNQGVIFSANLKLRLSPQEQMHRPEPDGIVCTGAYAQEIFLNISCRSADRLKPGCTLRHIPVLSREKNSKDIQERQKLKKVLVALDGVYNTVMILDWLCEHSQVFKDYQVCVRAHPNVSLTELVSQSLVTIPDHFQLSYAALDEDLLNCSCVIYRHTSIGIQALLNGIPVIHLAVSCPLSGDPIEELEAGKWKARTPQELQRALQEISRLNLPEWEKTVEKSKSFLREYFTVCAPERINSFLEV